MALPELTDYMPTPKERDLLNALLAPENVGATVTEICQSAGCSRPIYYDAFAKPGFQAIYRDRCIQLVKESVGPILKVFEKEAMKGSYLHGKLLLEMAGMHTDKREITGRDGGPIELTAIQAARERLDGVVAGIAARRLEAGSTKPTER